MISSPGPRHCGVPSILSEASCGKHTPCGLGRLGPPPAASGNKERWGLGWALPAGARRAADRCTRHKTRTRGDMLWTWSLLPTSCWRCGCVGALEGPVAQPRVAVAMAPRVPLKGVPPNRGRSGLGWALGPSFRSRAPRGAGNKLFRLRNAFAYRGFLPRLPRTWNLAFYVRLGRPRT